MASYQLKKPGETVEDCRDFLRTGRCKYGASCKFNHPPNVQSGGGIKNPIDPSEPLFPIRLNEPVCQYYMKHGTCKFSQACKFHHPPQSSLQTAAGLSSNALFISRSNDQQPIVLNSVGQDQGSTAVMLQFLPQRPDEPDCLYFLRNGTCKYGATCRYHHPVSYHQSLKASDAQRRSQQQIVLQGQVLTDGTLQYMRGPAVFQQSNSRVVSTSGGQHMLVTETPIQVTTIKGGSVPQVPVDDFALAGGPQFGTTDLHASSSPSIPSSYETNSSGLEFVVQGQGSWDRSSRNKSGGNLAAFADSVQTRQQSLHTSNRLISGNDASTQSRRNRAASFGSSMGSASDLSGLHDGVIGWSTGSSSQTSRQLHNGQYLEGGNLADLSRRQSHYSFHEELPQKFSGHDQSRNAKVLSVQRQSRVGNVDHGLSLMTSALLNMMDTQEDVAAMDNPSRISSSSTLNNSTASPATPPSGNLHSPMLASTSMTNERKVPISASSPNLYHHEHAIFTSQVSSDHLAQFATTKSTGFEEVSNRREHSFYSFHDGMDRLRDCDPATDYRDWALSWQNVVDGRKAQGESAPYKNRTNGSPSSLSNPGLYFP